DWAQLRGIRPDVGVVMPCGYYVEESRSQALAQSEPLHALEAERIFAVDAASSFSRPGPRLVDGVELLAHLLHPEAAAAPAGVSFAEVGSGAGWASTAPSSG
ncbi:MAG: hypothetical protein ACRDKV_00035, partial [Solirubrobacterales bacterium]